MDLFGGFAWQVDNPDQRIDQDVDEFVGSTRELVFGGLGSVVRPGWSNGSNSFRLQAYMILLKSTKCVCQFAKICSVAIGMHGFGMFWQ